MEELDLRELLDMFWNKKVQIILVTLIFIVIGFIYSIGFKTPMYTSSTTLLLTSQQKNSEGIDAITATDVTLNSKLVSTYSELVKSKNVLRQVKSNLGMNIDEEDLRNNIKVSSVKDTELIEIAVTNKDPVNAAKIANEIAKVFTEKVKEFYNIENVQTVDNAEIKDEPSNIDHKKDIAIFGLIGLVVSAAYVLVANMLDTTVKTVEDIEKTFKMPVLAAVPTYNTELQKTKSKKGGRK